MIWVELTLLLACILVGARIGGIGLGVVAGLGLACFVFVFGTTRIGSYVVNHSFMRPGLVTTIVATCTSLALARLILG